MVKTLKLGGISIAKNTHIHGSWHRVLGVLLNGSPALDRLLGVTPWKIYVEDGGLGWSGKRVEQERSHNTERRSSALQGPEQIGILCLRALDDS